MLSPSRKISWPWMTAAATLATLPLAQASVNVQSYTSAANSTYTLTEDAMLQVAPNDPTWNGQRMFFSAQYNWLNDPLIEYSADRTLRTDTLVDSIQTLDLTVGWFVTRRISLDFSAPLNLVHIPNQAQQFSLGDSRAFAKIRLTSDNALVAISVMPELRLPTGDASLFLSDGGLGLGASLAFEHDFGSVRAAANIGYRYSPNAQFRDIDYTHRMPMALGVFVPVGPKWGVNAEYAGALVLPINHYENPSEAYLGARYQIWRDAALLGGVGLGSFNSSAGNDIRASVGIRFSPMPEAPVAYAVLPVKPVPAPIVVAKAPAPVKSKRVVFTAKEIQINEEVKFKNGSAVLTRSGRNLLDEVARVIKYNRNGYKKILIEGHTNELGSYPYNQTLSERRAASVGEYLSSRGVTARDLMTIGYGKTKPKFLSGLSKGAKLIANRRVEFKVIN